MRYGITFSFVACVLQLYRQPVGRGFWQERDQSSLLCTASRGEILKKGGRIAWITPSNALVQDACNRLSGAISVDMIRRVMPWEAELRALTTVPRKLISFDPEIGRASGSEKQLIAHVNTFNTSQHKSHTASPILIPSALNNLAKDLAEGDRTEWSDYLRGQDELKSAPDEYAANFASEYPTSAAISLVPDTHRTVSLLEVEMLRKHTDGLLTQAFTMLDISLVVASDTYSKESGDPSNQNKIAFWCSSGSSQDAKRIGAVLRLGIKEMWPPSDDPDAPLKKSLFNEFLVGQGAWNSLTYGTNTSPSSQPARVPVLDVFADVASNCPQIFFKLSLGMGIDITSSPSGSGKSYLTAVLATLMCFNKSIGKNRVANGSDAMSREALVALLKAALKVAEEAVPVPASGLNFDPFEYGYLEPTYYKLDEYKEQIYRNRGPGFPLVAKFDSFKLRDVALAHLHAQDVIDFHLILQKMAKDLHPAQI
ncbi:hypothetical protein BKA56DRAFT_726782 [Ilyonectria sp. MPI-CAGE-AT-0026]|nr:hypothetical protein BKA56DRAFT_726782 [Ilyonectria sp. MPI-CAGE-AT-0026]